MEESIEELEARLYAQVHHENNDDNNEVTSEAVDLPPNYNKQSNKRYWQKSKNLSTQKEFQPLQNSYKPNPQIHTNSYPKTLPTFSRDQHPVLSETTAPSAIKSFVPYSSVLSFMGSPSQMSKIVDETMSSNYEKKKNKSTKFPKNGKLLNPIHNQVTRNKSAMKLDIQVKKQKAVMSRKKAQNKIVTVELEESDESDCIPIELPAPPLITLDSSDEETIQKKRAMSPSISSIISDDFIVAGDKRRLANPFKHDEVQQTRPQKITQETEKFNRLTKAATSSSDSARSSCDRVVEQTATITPEPKNSVNGAETRSKRKNRKSLDNEDSVYVSKGKTAQQSSSKPNDSSEDETPCVNAKNKPRRRKSAGSRQKSNGSEKEADDDPILGPIAQLKKRSRFITPSYDDDEFATMISTIVRVNETVQDDSDAETSGTSFAKPPEPESSSFLNRAADAETSIIEINESINEEDCEIVETPQIIYEVPDEVASDSDDSMRGVQLPINCDLSLNVTQVPYDPHEYIRDYGESSKETTFNNTCDALVNPEIGWNDEMKFFYDGSWGDENFCISKTLSELPRDQKFWRVINADRNRTSETGKRIRCMKCNEFGHFANKCNRPRKRVVCFMCGEEGHRETRCPNSICLRCGKPNKVFATTCTSCSRLVRKHCPLCNFQGHDMDQCPDKWRRYHSTTTDSHTLNSEFKVNDRMFCSVCGRRGHFAENCNHFLKTINGLITSSVVKVISYRPSYPRIYLNSFDPVKTVEKDQQQLLALFTYFPYYRFNFKFARNVRMYPKFINQFKLHMKRREEAQTPPAIEATPKDKKTPKKRDRKSKKAEKRSAGLQISVTTTGNRIVTSSDTAVDPDHNHDHDSNSNYSFTEFYSTQQQQEAAKDVFKSPNVVAENSFENSIQAVINNETNVEPVEPEMVPNPFAVDDVSSLADYIPLGNDENTPRTCQIEREPEVSCEAQVMLTKEHFLMLSNEKGQNFLFDLQNRLNVTAEFKWDNTGNSLIITGIPSNQSLFHLEVREYLYQVQLLRHEKIMESSSQLPKNKASIVSFLKVNLQSINKIKYFGAKKSLETMITAEKNLDHKKTLKHRKSLNIALIGAGELCDGGEHIGALRRILYTLEKELHQGKIEISQQVREEIMFHMKPIFSTMNHGDYRNLFNQYLKVMKQRQKKNLLYNPILS